MPTQSYILPLLVLVPLIAGLVMLLPLPMFNDRRNIFHWSLLATLATFALSLKMAFAFDFHGPTFQLRGMAPWVSQFGLQFGWGVDAISLWLILLTTFLMPIVVLSSLTAITERSREYYFWLLLIQAAMTGTFIATDIIFFYICFEFTLVPLYFLIGVFGSGDRLRAAAVFFIYTFTGSMLTFAAVLYVAYHAGWNFDIEAMYLAARSLSGTEQAWIFLALMAGFAVKVPIWPLHTWLPLAHTEAPTAGSVILAGVLLKLGTYGILRFVLPMCPLAVLEYAPYVGVMAICGIILTALICWVQTDIKRLIAYSSVSHLGFCVLGLFALDRLDIGAHGAVMYMVNHGLSTGALFLCIGMIYERFHTRDMGQMSGLGRAMPVWSSFMVFFVLASVGLPGLNGFVGEFLTLLGAFSSPPEVLGMVYAAVAGLGLIFGAIYLLYMVGRVIFGPTKLPHVHGKLNDLSGREIVVLAPIALACLVLGLAPYLMLDTLDNSLAQLTGPAKSKLPATVVQDELPQATVSLVMDEVSR